MEHSLYLNFCLIVPVCSVFLSYDFALVESVAHNCKCIGCMAHAHIENNAYYMNITTHANSGTRQLPVQFVLEVELGCYYGYVLYLADSCHGNYT